MPNEAESRIELYFTQEFKRNLRRLARKYRRIRSDLTPLLEKLEEGKTPGDQIPRTGYTVYKVRVANSNLQRGKRGGYRVIYSSGPMTPGEATRISLITIYSKTEQGDISIDKLRRILEGSEDAG
jgi:mRNA-degrading endonuclease RelE of RelBE toxin-antitoxin system